MPEPLRQPSALLPPDGDDITEYDRSHVTQYLQLLDADAVGIHWAEAAVRVLSLDMTDVGAARRTFDANLARARWMASKGYRHLLK